MGYDSTKMSIIAKSPINTALLSRHIHKSILDSVKTRYTVEYAVEVVGKAVGGGITLDETDYVHGATVLSTEFLTAADVTVKAVDGYEAKVTVDAEDKLIRVVYSNGDDASVECPMLNAQEPQPVYDLQGRCVENPTSGLYIVGRKKMVI